MRIQKENNNESSKHQHNKTASLEIKRIHQKNILIRIEEFQ